MAVRDWPAFPVHAPGVGGYPPLNTGLTKREYIAIEAMAALIGAPRPLVVDGNEMKRPEDIAAAAYLFADVMIDAGQK